MLLGVPVTPYVRTLSNANAYTKHQGWPVPYICTVYDCTFGDFHAKNTVCTAYKYLVLANPTKHSCESLYLYACKHGVHQ
jgi:hypothetical protein